MNNRMLIGALVIWTAFAPTAEAKSSFPTNLHANSNSTNIIKNIVMQKEIEDALRRQKSRRGRPAIPRPLGFDVPSLNVEPVDWGSVWGRFPIVGADTDAPRSATKIQLQPSRPPWTKVCGTDGGKKLCYTTRDYGRAPEQPPVLAIAVYEVAGPKVRYLLRLLLPVSLLLRPGFRFSVDAGPAYDGSFAICFPNGCFAETDVSAGTLASLKEAATLDISVRNQKGNEVVFSMPLTGFAKGFDGPPIAPKQLATSKAEITREIEDHSSLVRDKQEH